MKAAYDYRAYGKRLSLVQSSDRVTEEFTGKELDEEVDLGYWGARFLDIDLGMWTSVDPARQYSSPYTYCDNNPHNVVDDDGLAGSKVGVRVLREGAELVQKSDVKTMRDAIVLLRRGVDILFDSKPLAKEAAKGSSKGKPMAHPDGHKLSDGSTGRGHYHGNGHPDGVGHAFFEGLITFLTLTDPSSYTIVEEDGVESLSNNDGSEPTFKNNEGRIVDVENKPIEF